MDQLNVAVIYCSMREQRQGIKGAYFVSKQLEKRGHEVHLIDPKALPLPLFEKGYSDYEQGTAPENLEQIHNILEKADGFILVCAEYNHGIPATLSNLLDHFMPEYKHKMSGIVTYSAGPFGGIRAEMPLRERISKLGAPSTPTSFAISKVQDAFDEDGNALETSYETRILKFIEEFEWFATATKNHRLK